MVVIVKEVVFVEISLYFYGCMPFHCKCIDLALYLDSLTVCIVVLLPVWLSMLVSLCLLKI